MLDSLLGVITKLLAFCFKVALVLLDSKLISTNTLFESVNVMESPKVTATV